MRVLKEHLPTWTLVIAASILLLCSCSNKNQEYLNSDWIEMGKITKEAVNENPWQRETSTLLFLDTGKRALIHARIVGEVGSSVYANGKGGFIVGKDTSYIYEGEK